MDSLEVNRCPAIVIAATSSGVGKTSLALGLSRALVRRGLSVQTFKVGPDFLDPSYLAIASGRACYNLDSWMTSEDYVRTLFARATQDAQFAIVEGVMGLFDGASPTTLAGSTAQIAQLLDAPVLLVVNAHGAARSLAATVKGFATFEPGVRIAAVVANHCGSDRHRDSLAQSLAAAELPPLAGALPRESLPKLHSRHLGLTSADSSVLPPAMLDELAAACEKYLDVDTIIRLAGPSPRSAGVSPSSSGLTDDARNSPNQAGGLPFGAVERATVLPPSNSAERTSRTSARGHSHDAPTIRIGVAMDEAFHFYYPDNLEALEAAGAKIVPFSPLHDAKLPDGIDGIYLGGGYPEVHAEALAANESMRAAIASFAASGRCIYAECGGLMYLGRSVRAIDGKTLPLAGVLPIDTEMLPRLKTLGYVEAQLAADSILGIAGAKVRGHEFHYSHITADDAAASGWRSVYRLTRRRGGDKSETPAPLEGFTRGNVQASYVHIHFASAPDIAAAFVQHCKERS